MPRVLSETDVAEFRDRLCAVAERLFAERGPEAVTMRQLTAELGVSPMTPYRYFEDKDEILATVRANGFNRFSEVLEAARDKAAGARAKGAAVAEAYVAFALAHPHTYKLMFDVNQPDSDRYPELAKAVTRSRATMTAWINDQIADGLMAGDPAELGAMFWAASHGAVVLELAGKLPQGAARTLQHKLAQTLARGLRPES
jgi:AcrR family transcriptional regulator